MQKPLEIELKARVSSLTLMRRRLLAIGGKLVKKSHQIDTYYSPEKRPLGKRKGFVLRVREQKGKGTGRFELHIPKNAYAAEELELIVDNIKLLQKILKLLNYKKEFVIDKHRETYTLGRVTVVLDAVRGLGTFLEVEIIGADTSANRAKLHGVLKKLGVQEKDICYNLHYHQMALKKQGRNPVKAYF
jgi:predicted adenylyl cyclase CyaB